MSRDHIESQWACASQDFDQDRHIVIQPFGTVHTHEYANLLMDWAKQMPPQGVHHDR